MNTGNISIKASVSGNTPGLKGEKGNGIKSTVLNDDYSLTFNYTNGTSDTTPPIRGQKGEKGDNGISPSITTSKSGKVTTITIKDATGTKVASINDGVDSQGDMLKSTYDKNSNGIVDNSEKVNGHTVESNVPANAKFTDTIYSHPINSGNKHIPSGGSSGQILKWEEDGTAKWDDSIEAHREGTELKVNNYKQLIKFTKEGKTEQKNYEGKSLIDYNNSTLRMLTNPLNGVSVSVDEFGIITLNGTSTDSVSFCISEMMTDLLKSNKKYSFFVENLNGAQSNQFSLILYGHDGSKAFNLSQIISTTSGKNVKNITSKLDYNTVYFWFYCNKGITFNNLKIRLMLTEGDYTIDTIGEFEPYVGGESSPSPDYPQKISNVRGVENLLKNTNVNSGDGNYWINYSTFDEETGVLTRSTTATTEAYINHNINNLKSNTTYTLFLEAKSNGYVSTMDLYCFNKNTEGIKSNTRIKLLTEFQKFKFTFTTDKNVDYSNNSTIRIDNNGSTIDGKEAILTIKNVMLVEGSYVNGCVTYGSNYLQLKNTTDNESKIINIDLKGNELCSDKEQTLKDELVIENGKAKIIKKYGEVALNGTENWTQASSNGGFTLMGHFNDNSTPNGLCNYFKFNNTYITWVKENYCGFNTSNVFWVKTSKFTTLAEFKAWLKSQYDSGTPVKVQYQLAEPKIIDLGEVDLDLLENSTLTCEEESDMQIDYLTIDSNIFVQDSLDGNSSQKAPSVDAVNEIISKLEARIIALENKNV